MATIPRSPARATLLTAAVLAVLAVGPAGAQTTLRWKFEPGESLKYQMIQKMVMKFTPPNGTPVENKMTQTIDTIWLVGRVEGGAAELTQKIERIRTTLESPNGQFVYDSKDGKKPEGPIGEVLGPIFDGLLGSDFTFKMNPRGEISDVKVPQKLVATLKGTANAGSAMFSEENLRNMIIQSTLPLPADAVVKGKSWTKTVEIPSGPIGSIALDQTYSYEGPADAPAGDLDKIALKTKIDFKAKAGVPVVPKVKSQDARGTFLFDRAKGRLVESDVTQKMELSFSGQNMEINQVIDTTSSMKLNPVEPAK